MARHDFAGKSDSAVMSELSDARRSLVQVRFALAGGRLEDSAKVGRLKRQIARLTTELRRREIAGGLRKGGLTDVEIGAAAARTGEASGGFLEGLVDKLN